jgi:hypothetical protein
MIDTVRVKYSTSPNPEQLKHWMHRTTTTETGCRESYLYNPVINNDKVMLKYTYYPLGYDNHPLLTLELSLPKLIYSNNYRMLLTLDGSIKAGNKVLAQIPHAPILDLAEGVLLRIDMCYNHQVGDAVDDYICAIGNLEYPHRRTKYHRGEGVEFKTKHITTKFYNKQRETGMIEAAGILRQETTILSGKEVLKLLGKKKKPTLLHITNEFIESSLNDDLRKLTLLDNSIATRDTALKTLCDAHGEYAGTFYYGLLVSRMNKSKRCIVSDTHIHPRSLDRKIHNIIDTGIALTLTNLEEPLPPLHVHL